MPNIKTPIAQTGITTNGAAVSSRADVSNALGTKVDGTNGQLTTPTITSSTFAGLGEPPAGCVLVFCTDCRKPGEPADGGTGMLVYSDGNNRWVTSAGVTASN